MLNFQSVKARKKLQFYAQIFCLSKLMATFSIGKLTMKA